MTANASVTSISFCELYKLHNSDLQMLRINFPDTFAGFAQAAKIEAKNANRMNKQKLAESFKTEKAVPWWIIKPGTTRRAGTAQCSEITNQSARVSKTATSSCREESSTPSS